MIHLCFREGHVSKTGFFFFLKREKFNGPVIHRLHQNLSPFFLSALNVYVRQRVKENVYGSRKLIFIS